ncbi:hypothetical protein D3C84_494240 [compost metagenome]
MPVSRGDQICQLSMELPITMNFWVRTSLTVSAGLQEMICSTVAPGWIRWTADRVMMFMYSRRLLSLNRNSRPFQGFPHLQGRTMRRSTIGLVSISSRLMRSTIRSHLLFITGWGVFITSLAVLKLAGFHLSHLPRRR